MNKLIQEAIERFNQKLGLREEKGGFTYLYEGRDELSSEAIKDFLKTELETIVKESFKNTRVEEKEMRCLECADSAECECRNNNFSYRLAISDKHNKECEFLGN